MALTKSFRETVQKRVKNDPAFRAQLLEEALNCFLKGDIDTGRNLLRDYLNATESTRTIANKMETNVKSLQRMVGPKGNPTTKNLFLIFNACTNTEGIQLRACVTPAAEVAMKIRGEACSHIYAGGQENEGEIPMKEKAFRELLASVREGGAILSGEVSPARSHGIEGPDKKIKKKKPVRTKAA